MDEWMYFVHVTCHHGNIIAVLWFYRKPLFYIDDDGNDDENNDDDDGSDGKVDDNGHGHGNGNNAINGGIQQYDCGKVNRRC